MPTHLACVACRMKVKVEAVYRDEKEAVAATAGENLRLRISGAEETDIMAGFVLSSIRNPVPMVTQFDAQVSRGLTGGIPV